MKPVRQQKIRRLLLDNPDGMTPLQIAAATGMLVSNVRVALRAMPDVYVDRWIKGKRGQYEKVVCVVYVPPNCPHPTNKVYRGGPGVPPKTRWVNQGAANGVF